MTNEEHEKQTEDNNNFEEDTKHTQQTGTGLWRHHKEEKEIEFQRESPIDYKLKPNTFLFSPRWNVIQHGLTSSDLLFNSLCWINLLSGRLTL